MINLTRWAGKLWYSGLMILKLLWPQVRRLWNCKVLRFIIIGFDEVSYLTWLKFYWYCLIWSTSNFWNLKIKLLLIHRCVNILFIFLWWSLLKSNPSDVWDDWALRFSSFLLKIWSRRIIIFTMFETFISQFLFISLFILKLVVLWANRWGFQLGFTQALWKSWFVLIRIIRTVFCHI